jgi:hypothetical protein
MQQGGHPVADDRGHDADQDGQPQRDGLLAGHDDLASTPRMRPTMIAPMML